MNRNIIKTGIITASLLLAGCFSASSEPHVSPSSSPSASAKAASDSSAHQNTLIVVYNSGENDDNPDASTGASTVEVNDVVSNPDQLLADWIQQKTGLDEYVIASDANYPSTTLGDIISETENQSDDYRPKLASQIDSFDSYDTFILVYPVWWYDLPRPMYTFFDTYDFSGKTIIPVNTNRGSGLSTTTDKIEALEPNANITDGFSIGADDITSSTRQDLDDFLTSM